MGDTCKYHTIGEIEEHCAYRAILGYRPAPISKAFNYSGDPNFKTPEVLVSGIQMKAPFGN